MKVFYLFLMMILLATFWLALSRVKRNSHGLTPLLGWLMGLGFFVIAPLAILTLNGGFRQPAVYDVNGSWDEVDLASWIFFRPYLITWLGLMLALFPVFLVSPNSRPAENLGVYVVSRRKLERVLLLTMAVAAVDWAVTIRLVGGISEFLMSHWYTRNEDLADRLGRAYVLYTHLSVTNQMIFTATAALYTGLGLKNRDTRWGFTGLLLLFFVLQIVASGNRIFFALYLLAFATSCWLYRRRKIITFVLLATPLLIFLSSAWSSVRAHLGDFSDSVTDNLLEADVGNASVSHLMGATEGSGVMLLMHMINDFGTKFPYLNGGTYARVVTRFMPAGMVPGRPPDFSTLAASLYQPGDTTSLGSTALGEAYANFGSAGILVLPALTWFGIRCGSVRRNGAEHSLLSAIYFVMFVSFARFPFAENAMTLMATAFIVRALGFERGLCRREPGVQGAANG